MGALPVVFTAYQAVTNDEARAKFEKAWGVELSGSNGLTLTKAINKAHEGEIKGMIVIGENPMVSDPDLHHVEEALDRLDFLLVQDIYLTETAKKADIVLPGVSFAEKTGPLPIPKEGCKEYVKLSVILEMPDRIGRSFVIFLPV